MIGCSMMQPYDGSDVRLVRTSPFFHSFSPGLGKNANSQLNPLAAFTELSVELSMDVGKTSP